MKLKLLITFLFPVAILNAQTFFTVDGIDYRTDVNSSVIIVGSDCSESELTIPSSVSFSGNNFDVTTIGENAFSGCTTLTKVNFPDTVTSIQRRAFSGCTGLETLNIPNTVIGMQDEAFLGCTGLTEAILNNTSRILSRGLFENCSSLATVNIQSSVTIIENNVFRNCTSLASVTFPSALEILGSSAFENTGITSVDLPSAQSFGDQVFARTPITSIDFPVSYTKVPNAIFSGCDQLATVNLPSAIRTIGNGAFSGCELLTSITLPNNLVEIGDGAFSGTGLDNIVLPNSVISLGDGAFSGCRSLEAITFSATLQTIGPRAFRRCDKLTNFVLPNSLIEIGNQAFEQCFDISEVIIPDSVTDIGSSAFNRCFDLVNVTLPNNLTALNSYVFNECRKLIAIEIPSSVTSISDFAFAKTALRDVTVKWQTPVAINANVFQEVTLAFADLFVPAGTVLLYETADVWKDFGVITESVQTTINIPDANFEQALIDQNIDSDGVVNGMVLASDIETITFLDVNSENISDLTGIEGFRDLETLFVHNNNLTTVDVSANSQLSGLVLAINNLSNIDVSQNTNLVSISLNQNNISSIDLSANTNITQVYIDDNQLSNIDLSQLDKLEELSVADNNLTKLEISKNPELRILNCSLNGISVLNTLSNTNLESLNCERNSIEYLDLSQNASLISVACNDNALIGLNIKNGANTNITNPNFSAFANLGLNCIEVDDVDYSNTNWGQIDMQTSYNLSCTPVNDDCSYTTPIILGQDTPGNTSSATGSSNNPNCLPSGLTAFDVWYSFPAPASGSVTMTISAGALVGKVALYSSCGDAQPLYCAVNELVVNGLIPNETYYLQVWLELSLTTKGNTSSKFLNESGTFTLNVQDSSVLSITDVQESKFDFSVFPNPAQDFIRIKSRNTISSIEIFTLSGQKLLHEKTTSNNTNTIDVTYFDSGLYLLKINSETKSYTKKLVIK